MTEEYGEPEYLEDAGPKEEEPARRPRRERFRPGLAEKDRKWRNIFGIVFLVVAGIVFGGIYYIVKFYKKPPKVLAVALPENGDLEFSDWQAESKQRAVTVGKGGRKYVDEWFVEISGFVKNRTKEPKKIPGVRVDVLNRAGKVVARRDLYVGTLEPGETRHFSALGNVDDQGNRPSSIRVSISDHNVSKEHNQLQQQLEDLQRRLNR